MSDGTEIETKPDNLLRSEAEDPYLGSQIQNKYLVIRLLGKGGWANVYLAKHLNLGTEVAIKLMHDHLSCDYQRLKRFEQEARVVSRLESPHVVKIFDYGIIDPGSSSPHPFIVMDYFGGVPLSDLIQQEQPIKKEQITDLFIQLCSALEEAHGLGIVHRDLKPSNILLKIDGDEIQGKLVDFGIAKAVTGNEGTLQESLTSTGDTIGSPAYMPPEQWIGADLDHRADIYSLGCVMFEVATGNPVFDAKNPVEFLRKHCNVDPTPPSKVAPERKIAPDLDLIILKCLQKDKEKRYKSAKELKADLQSLSKGEPLLNLRVEQRILHKLFTHYKTAVLIGIIIYFLAAIYVEYFGNSWQSQFQRAIGNYASTPKASMYFYRALNQVKDDDEKLRNQATIYGAWAQMYQANDDFNDAESCYKKANSCIEEYGTKKGKNKVYWRPLHAEILEGMAACSGSRNAPEESIDFLTEAIQERQQYIRDGAFGLYKDDNIGQTVKARSMLSKALMQTGQVKQALDNLELARADLSKGSRNDYLMASVLQEKAELMERSKFNPEQYLPVYTQALALLKSAIGETPQTSNLEALIEKKKRLSNDNELTNE